jgi:hypothetical protein
MDAGSLEIIHSYLNVFPLMTILDAERNRMYLLSSYSYYVLNPQTLEISPAYDNSNFNFNENIAVHPDGSRVYSLEASYFHIFDAGANIDLGYLNLPNRQSQGFKGTWVSYVPDTISGRVTQNDAPLPGALIRLEGNGIVRETHSDAQGNYHFAVNNGSYHIEAFYQSLFVTPEFIQVEVSGTSIIEQNFVVSGSAPSPSVELFVSPTNIQAGENATLSWDSTDATSASIDNGIGAVPVDGTMTISPTQSATYIIAVTGPGGTATATAIVTVNSEPPPGIVFSAVPTSIQRGQSSILNWTTTNAVSATINQGIGSVSLNGSQSVSPQETTIYMITVIGPGGSSNAQVTVAVTEPLPQVQLTADPIALLPGHSATLTWTSVDAETAMIDNNIGNVPVNGSIVVSPIQDTTYTITVTSTSGIATASVTIKMLDSHLRDIWGGMKEAMIDKNIDGAIAFFTEETQLKYQEIYAELLQSLPQIVSEMPEIELVEFVEGGAQYRIKRRETYQGIEYDITYYVYFIKDEDGTWKILKY